MNKELQVSSLSNLQSFNQDGLRVAFQSGQFLQTQKPIKLNKYAFIGIGITQMIIGVTCFGLNIRLLSIEGGLSCVGYGIWGGIFFFLSGLLTVSTGCKSTSERLIVSTMFVNVFSACAAVPVLIFGVLDTVGLFYDRCGKIYKMSYDVWPSTQISEVWPTTEIIEVSRKDINYTIAALAIIEAIISTICSVLCCNTYCCFFSRADNVVVIYPRNLSNSNDSVSGYQGLVIPPQPQPPPVPQQPLSSQNIPSLYEDVDAY